MGCGSLRRWGTSRHAGRCSELNPRRVSDRGPSPARGDATGERLILRRKFCRGEVIHRRLRRAYRASPRPRLNNFVTHISDPAQGTQRLQPRRSRRVRCSAWLGGIINTSLFLFGCATIVALNRSRINVALGLFVIPLLVSRLPNLFLAALAASEWLIEIKLGQSPVGVDVRKLAVVGWHSRWMTSLLNRSETQNSLGLSNLRFGGISAGLCVATHGACAAA